ncbi:MAG TPA: helix-turn-helix domain-containing protein [Solirubrobacteraceae bacterium]|nr:helix-turn-helix domain-containing protein [Solirubrobacteraceae bacterium]
MTDTAIDTERPLRADARRNRERILESARAVFAEYGADAQIDDVAREAGVGVGTVYRHFPTKEALLVELLREKFRMFALRAREALEQDGEPFAAVEDLLRGNAETMARDAAIQQALAGAGEHIWMQAETELQELLAITGELVARARRAGMIRQDLQATDIGMLMCGLCSTMGSQAPGFDWRRHLELIIDMLRAR